MATSLIQGASSAYINAQNTLRSKQTVPEVYVYVEGLDDVAFWKECLRPFCSNHSFKVTQLRKPDGSIAEGKRHLIEIIDIQSLGANKYVAVDADYDWIIDNYKPSSTTSSISDIIRNNPYILHTFLYAIENYKCHPLCIAEMMDKISGDSDEKEIQNIYSSFSIALSQLFLAHIVSSDKCDGRYALRDFRNDVDALTMDLASMQLDEKSRTFIRQRETALKDYIVQNRKELENYRQKLKDYGFDESKYFLLMQGHIIEKIFVKKHLPRKILEIRRGVMNEICRCDNEGQLRKRLKQFERRTGITETNESNYKKSTNALLKDINSRLDQLIDDCNEVNKAVEGYYHLRKSLENAFGTPSY
ncbi:MAG: DUF4435 domain-containing protein [Muribaculaceae bacterium]|nr:DUF4435 domain-containing protein [Muribaculaceae bacterium]